MVNSHDLDVLEKFNVTLYALLTYFSVFYELNMRASLVGAINISLNG